MVGLVDFHHRRRRLFIKSRTTISHQEIEPSNTDQTDGAAAEREGGLNVDLAVGTGVATVTGPAALECLQPICVEDVGGVFWFLVHAVDADCFPVGVDNLVAFISVPGTPPGDGARRPLDRDCFVEYEERGCA